MQKYFVLNNSLVLIMAEASGITVDNLLIELKSR
jgi:hypothetical protein